MTSSSAETDFDFSRFLILPAVQGDVFALTKKGYNRTVFWPEHDHAGDPRIFAESAGKKQLPPPVAGSRQAGGEEGCVWACGCVVVAGGMVHGGVVVWWHGGTVAWWYGGMVHGA